MLFNSYVFLLAFLPVTLLGYYGLIRLGARHRALDWLVAASLVFYGWWRWSNVLLLAGSMIVNYAMGTWIGKRGRTPQTRLALALGVAVNLLVLGHFKYTNFFITNANAVLGLDWSLTRIVLPLGISFFTFQEVAYLVDSYRGLTLRYGFRDFCLFISFFPQLIAGPIVHHAEVMPQFRRRECRPTAEDLSVGLTLFTLGLAKKVLVADQFARYASPIFDAAGAGNPVGFAAAWMGALSYAMQIYFDFSAYSDMALGLGRLFGIRLPLNFDSPYKAVNIADFWRRWHMTLSRFLRDYLYIPLGGNRRGPRRRYVNLMLTMVIGGLWHGAGWTFVIWGTLHGIYLSAYHGWRAWRERRGRKTAMPAGMGIWVGRVATFFFVLVAWVFFRADSVAGAFQMLGAMAGANGFSFEVTQISLTHAAWFGGIFLLVVWTFPNSHEMVAEHQPALEYTTAAPPRRPVLTPRWLGRVLAWQPRLRWAIPLAALMAWSILNLSRPSEFIYWQF